MSERDILIRVETASKKFCKSLKRSLWYGVQDLTSELLCLSKDNNQLRKDEFFAVKNVSFELRRGDCLGLIGPNGAGKSTLLKMLNGLIKPDDGRITIRGRVGALIELGAGFNPILTARENVYVNASILGLSKKEIDKKFDEIVDFAGIGEFLDAPIQSFSSGMKVRLGFAIAAQLNPDVLLIDEILAVGDAGFRARCYDAIYSLLENTAVIFVSHNMLHINRMCSSVMVMDKGVGKYFGNPSDGISHYFNLTSLLKKKSMIHSTTQAKIKNLSVTSAEGENDIHFGKSFEVSFQLWLAPEITSVTINLSILSRDQVPVASTRTKIEGCAGSEKSQLVRFISPHLTLSPEKYSLGITIFNNVKLNQILWYQNISPFEVSGEAFWGCPVTLIGSWDTRVSENC
jgi:lipopolysaccharide transport system ATP-binding protein